MLSVSSPPDHGGVLYLDERGWTPWPPVQAFFFGSTKAKNDKVKDLHFLRVGMKNYRVFVQSWAEKPLR